MLRRFLRLPKTEKVLIVRSLLLVVAIRVLLWIIPARLAQRVMFRSSPVDNSAKENNWEQIKTIVRSIRSVSRFIPGATCLTQALAASILIRQFGQSAQVKIGVTKDDRSRLIAHAWLEKDGRIILGEVPDQCRFITLKAFPI